MIFAEINGKLNGALKLDARREDALTSNVFGLLRYVPDVNGIFAVLRRARKITLRDGVLDVADVGSWLPINEWSRCDVTFWPRYGRFGEPDLRLDMFDSAGSMTARMLVEAKFLCGKSDRGRDDGEFDPAVPDPDQLVRYWQALCAESVPECFRALLYLTAHAIPPEKELVASLRKTHDVQLGWLSWHDIWRTVSTRTEQPMRDLSALLAHKSLKPFTGFSRGRHMPFPEHTWYLARLSWFSSLTVGPLPPSSFWRER